MRHSLSIPLILFAALLAWALMTPTQTLLVPTPPSAAIETRIPDSYAQGVVEREFDANGVLVSRTETTRLRRYRGAEITELDLPRRESFSADGNWVATANSGLLREGQETLQLDGHVELRYARDGVEFYSPSMLINLQERTARSLAPVEIRQGAHRISADNMFITLESERATLTGGVQSTYVP